MFLKAVDLSLTDLSILDKLPTPSKATLTAVISFHCITTALLDLYLLNATDTITVTAIHLH